MSKIDQMKVDQMKVDLANHFGIEGPVEEFIVIAMTSDRVYRSHDMKSVESMIGHIERWKLDAIARWVSESLSSLEPGCTPPGEAPVPDHPSNT